MGMNSDSNKSSRYPFYVELESSDGLIMGQHVYVEPDLEQGEAIVSEGIWIPDYMVDRTDPDHPFVWKDSHGKLVKQEVTISETREELGKVKISEGLEPEDSICIPDPSLSAGMKTAPMSEKPAGEKQESGVEGEELNESVEVSPVQTEGMPAGMEGSPEGGEIPDGMEGSPEEGAVPADTESSPEGEKSSLEEAGVLKEDIEAGSGMLDIIGGQK